MPDKLGGENRYHRLAQDVKHTATKPEGSNGLLEGYFILIRGLRLYTQERG